MVRRQDGFVVSTQPARRRYESELRDEQARRTRRAIVTAARELFLAQGYAATTIDAIAAAARVSRRTVFTSVGGKGALLKLVFDWAIVGDDEAIAMADRPEVAAIKAETDPARALAMWVHMVVAVHARVAAIGEVVSAAADVDPAAAELLATADRNRLFGAAAFVDGLASLRGLAPGMTKQRAADLCWTISDPYLYRRLVGQRGWSEADFEHWVTESLRATLLQ